MPDSLALPKPGIVFNPAEARTPNAFDVLLRAFFYMALVLAFVSFGEWGLVFLPLVMILPLMTKRVGLELLVVFILILSSNCLEFVPLNDVPYVQIGAGFRLNAQIG